VARAVAGPRSTEKYSGEAQPIIQDGIVCIATGADDVFAVSVQTGRLLWKHTAKPGGHGISTLRCGRIDRNTA
jgi:quinohemoprotein ethanol dehydrogenase